MKKLITIITLIPYLCFGQVQIGNDIDGEAAGDNSGFSTTLSADGSVVAVGANFNAGGGAAGDAYGHVRVFKNTAGNWTQIGSDIDGDPGDQCGQSVSLSADGSIIAIAEPIDNDVDFASGQVRVYEDINGTWTQIGNEINGDMFNDQVGRGLDLSSDGSILAVGAFGANSFIGQARVYENQGGSWVQIGNDINGDEALDLLGFSISTSSDGSIVAIGAIGNPSTQEIGYVKVVQNIGGTWTQIGSNIVGALQGYGNSVSLSSDGSIVAIGGPGEAPEGKVQVFQNNGGNWVQIGSDLLGEGTGDQFGFAVSLSAGGNILAVGAKDNSSINTNAGRTYIFQNQGGTWIQLGNSIDGEASGDFSGRSVHISADASTLSIGAPSNDGNGADAGHVRVYDLSSVVSINELNIEASIKIYPNPSSSFLNINLNEGQLKGIEVHSLTGSIIYKTNLSSNQYNLNIVNYPTGTYILKIINQNFEVATIKFVKE